MELVAPAGNLNKLKTAFLYGADAVYIGLDLFSLRAKADNLNINDCAEIIKLKGPKKVYATFNIYFQEDDFYQLEKILEQIEPNIFDAFIIADLGVIKLFRKYFPHTPLHLSTQANCTNSEAVKLYKELGFSRIILARELKLSEIEKIKKNSDLEIEVFVHGAMCLAYSGRCLLSAYLTQRSANRGNCSHPCRWSYRLFLEEAERKGELFPLTGGENFTSILSSKDLCMINYIPNLLQAGVDAIKIEGRMKSEYYVAQTCRCYRKAIEIAQGLTAEAISVYYDELLKVSHREYSTGFFFDREEISKPTLTTYKREYLWLGKIISQTPEGLFAIELKNTLTCDDTIEYVGLDILYLVDKSFILYNEKKERVFSLNHNMLGYIETALPLKIGYLIRKKIVK